MNKAASILGRRRNGRRVKPEAASKAAIELNKLRAKTVHREQTRAAAHARWGNLAMCGCGCGLTLERAKMRHPKRAVHKPGTGPEPEATPEGSSSNWKLHRMRTAAAMANEDGAARKPCTMCGGTAICPCGDYEHVCFFCLGNSAPPAKVPQDQSKPH